MLAAHPGDEDLLEDLVETAAAESETAQALVALRPDLQPAALAKPLTMLLFGMINWMFTWMKPGGALDHQALAPMVADLFLGGLPAVRLSVAAAAQA